MSSINGRANSQNWTWVELGDPFDKARSASEVAMDCLTRDDYFRHIQC